MAEGAEYKGLSGPKARAAFFDDREYAKANKQWDWRPEAGWPDLTVIHMYRLPHPQGGHYVKTFYGGERVIARTEAGAGWRLEQIGCSDLPWVLFDDDLKVLNRGDSITTLAKRGHNLQAKLMEPRSGWARTKPQPKLPR